MSGRTMLDGAVVEAAWAKVNLTLQITGRRPDGYHELVSLVVFADIGDELHFMPADTLSLSVEGPFATALADEDDNLVLRAARAVAERKAEGHGAAITLVKNLPVASGIGGGSADAAASLRGLLRLWDRELAEDELQDLALTLGADVPVCLRGDPVVISGIGEKLSPIPALPPLWLLLVNPGVALSTAEVFAAREGGFFMPSAPDLPPFGLPALIDWLGDRPNDLQAPACRIAPVVAEVLAALAEFSGCLLSRMSGSGATCFGLFEDETAARHAAEALALRYPEWWVAPAPLRA